LAAVAVALGVRETPGSPLDGALRAAVRGRDLLLVLDNCEHVVGAAGELAADLLAAAPALRILATSRTPLRLRGEQEIPVPPLALPDLDALPPVATLAGVPAVRLFVERARAVRPDFALTPVNAAVVAEICARLDGLPLALELAAARLKVLSPAALLALLAVRAVPASPLRLLTAGPGDLPARQRTLRDAIAWSHDLLDPEGRALFRRLAVFAGSFDLEAAAAVVLEGGLDVFDVVDGLAGLVDQSLLRVEPARMPEELLETVAGAPLGIEAPRYGMLETIRAYALEQLAASAEAEAVRRAHALHFLSLAERAAPVLDGPAGSAWTARLEAEHPNLRAALGWSLQAREVELGLRLAAALWRFWQRRGHFAEGRGWLERLLQLAAGAAGAAGALVASRALALHAAGTLALDQGDYGPAADLLAEALAVRRALGDRLGEAETLNSLGVLGFRRGTYQEAAARFEEAQATYRTLSDERGLAKCLGNLGILAAVAGDGERAVALFEESLAIERGLGDARGVAYALNNLGALDQGRDDGSDLAIGRYEEALAIWRELGDRAGMALSLRNLAQLVGTAGDRPRATALYAECAKLCGELGDRVCLADVLEGLALSAAAWAEFALAARLAAAAGALREHLGAPLPPSHQDALDRLTATAREALGEATFQATWLAGREAAPEQTLADLLGAALLAPEAPAARSLPHGPRDRIGVG
jgi:predicted ATPase